MRRSHLWAAAAVALGVTVAGCSGGSRSPLLPARSRPRLPPRREDQVRRGRRRSPKLWPTPSAYAAHGVPNFPDPVQTPSGGYGYRTAGIDPNSAAFQGALQACKALPSPWNSTGQQLSPAQQQAWLNWAQCIRAHGLPDFPDPTFSGSEVHDSGVGSSSPQLQQAMDACKSQSLPSVALAGDRQPQTRG